MALRGSKRASGWALGAVLALLLAGCRGDARQLGIQLDYQEHRLKNGLRVLIATDATVPVVSYQSWFRVGSVDEKPGETGIAHLFEHLMFKGTPRYPAKEFFRQLEAKGAEVNAFTGRDFTVYYQNFTPMLLEKVIDMESDRLQHLILDEATLETERQVVLEERRLSVENSPDGRMQEAVWALAFRKHPYRNPVIGWPEDLGAINVRKLRDFFSRHYQPKNLTLVITGAVDPKKTLALVERYYGRIPGRAAPARDFKPEPETQEERRIRLEDAVVSERLLMAYRATRASEDDTYALDVLANILFEGTSSRAWRRLVDRDNQALAVGGSSYTPTFPGLFLVSASMRDRVPADVAERTVTELIREVQDHGVTADEVAVAVRQMTVEVVDSVRTPFGLGQLLGTVATTLGEVRGFEDDLKRYLRVSPSDVQRVARKYLVPNRRVVVVYGPPEAASMRPAGGSR